MEAQKFCQSCTMPINDPEDRGTEKDGSKSDVYCKYCYMNGAFTDPGITLKQMMDVARAEMEKQHLPDHIIQQTMSMLPHLKRWQQTGEQK